MANGKSRFNRRLLDMQTSPTRPIPICKDCKHSGYVPQGLAWNDSRKWSCFRPLPDVFNPVTGWEKKYVDNACESERNQYEEYRRKCGPNGDFFETK